MKARKRWMKIGALALSFACIAGISLLFDNFIRVGSTNLIQNSVNDISKSTQAALEEALEELEHIETTNSSVCSPVFLAEVAQHVQHSIFLRQVLVENVNGAQFCGSPNVAFEYEVVSQNLSIPDFEEQLSAVKIVGAEQAHIMLKITRKIDHTQLVSVFVEISSMLASNSLPGELDNADIVKVAFTDGTSLLTIGDPMAFDFEGGNNDYIFATSLAENFPIIVSAAMPYSIAQARRRNMYIAVLIISTILGFTYLLLGWKIINAMKAPAFDLEHAISSGEIRPYYQPVVDLSTGKLAGCEMLARWVKPDGEIISPNVFIEYAEVTGLAVPMTISLMEQVKHDLGEAYERHREAKVAINLFAGHFTDMTIVEDTKKVFEDSSISMDQLVFEITERYPLGENTKAVAVIAGLHDLGCKLALDDVGTGHSNLAHVQNLGVDIIKIDRVFVSEITPETTVSPVLDGLIRMSQELGSGIVAEGVETKAQAVYLGKRGIRDVQGFLFSPAVPADKYIEMLDRLNGAGGDNNADKDDMEKIVKLHVA